MIILGRIKDVLKIIEEKRFLNKKKIKKTR